MKTIILTFAVLAASFTIFSQTQTNSIMNTNKKTIVLVHGAWADVSSWDKVTPLLEAAGYEVIAVNLPGHGKDNTPVDKLSLQGYADAVKSAIGSRTDVILVAHSMSGMNASLVAEQIPSQLSKVIYLSAFLPKDGESAFALSIQDKESVLTNYLKVDESNGTGSFPMYSYVEFFAPDAPNEVKDNLIANFKAEALAPLQAPVSLTEKNFGRVKKVYIHDVNDIVVGYKLQQQMVKDAGITTVYTLASSHTPFFSMPHVLSEIILKESN
jgi:pimeloyl-ACP methyl ester carboxylesterase